MIYDRGPTRGEYIGHMPMLNKKLVVKLSYMFHSINPQNVYFYDMGSEGEEFIALSTDEYGKTWVIGPSNEE